MLLHTSAADSLCCSSRASLVRAALPVKIFTASPVENTKGRSKNGKGIKACAWIESYDLCRV